MEKFLEKLEEYNIFNYLLPGIIFTYLLKYYVGIDIFQSNLLEMAFIYYFIGSVVSRVGSIVLEKILRKKGFIKYSSYEDYINATDKDKMIEKLLVSNNMYRTICSVFIIILLLKVIICTFDNFCISSNVIFSIVIISGAILYLFSYKKQTEYIFKRVENVKINNRKNCL